MKASMPTNGAPTMDDDVSIGRIVSVTGAKAIVLLDGSKDGQRIEKVERPEMGTLLAINTDNTIVLAIVSALSVPVPAQREGEGEIWIAELNLVGELWLKQDGSNPSFNRGVTVYPALGDRVRVAGKAELQMAFCGDTAKSVRVGSIRQDSSIPAMVRVDDLLGKHFAILGTTGTGKSCTTALILRAILEKHPAAHMVLLDPHNEYAPAFQEWAEVISPRNMQLPYWLLTFEEIAEVLIGDENRKAEIEILAELIPIAKSRYSVGRGGEAKMRRQALAESNRFTVDTPVPYRISDLTQLIDERMGKLENKKDLAPYRQIKMRIDTITQDVRYAFMFGSLTVYDSMAQVLGRIFRVPVDNKPLTILELTGLPTEIVNVVVSVLCRMTFDFALWSEGRVPVTLICEEAHRYVPAKTNLGFEPCKRAVAKIAKEGRKYGASLCIITQRPAEIDPTILSQCNTVFALRMSNDRDQEIVSSAISDTGSGLLEFLSALGQREAIAFGDGVTLPVRIKFDDLKRENLPRSSTAQFSACWQKPVGDQAFLEHVVERWRSSGLSTEGEPHEQHVPAANAPQAPARPASIAPTPSPAPPASVASTPPAAPPASVAPTPPTAPPASIAPTPPAAPPAAAPPQRAARPAAARYAGQDIDPYAAQPTMRREPDPHEKMHRTPTAGPAPSQTVAAAGNGNGAPAMSAGSSLRRRVAGEAGPANVTAGGEDLANNSSALQSLRQRLMQKSTG